jgi:hypothetical protein
MLKFIRPVTYLAAAGCLAGFLAAPAGAQPALTTIQDILYRADGSRFTGTMNIAWDSFQAQDTSNIATANLTLNIVNGVLNVKLVPTTTATPGSQYKITYNSRGAIQFTETWAVPPSSLTLRVRDVRLTTGTVVGPQPVTSPVQIGDVVGLTNALNVRPTQGVGFAIGRAAVINSSGQVDGASGNLGDCVRVDGSSGPCGGGGGGGGVLPLFQDNEVPSGLVNGLNTTFTLQFTPSPSSSLSVYRNGILMKPGVDFTLSGNSLSFYIASVPQPGDLLAATYRYGNPNNVLGTLTSPQVVCSNVGTSTSSTTATSLGTCTIPAGLLGTGDRIEVRYQYAHTGSGTGFTPSIQWGSTTLLTRSAASAEGLFAGRLDLGVHSAGQVYDGQSWGSTTTFSQFAGTATENTTVAVTIRFRGQMSGSTSDSVALRNFTVVRYPAQSNP